MIVRGSCRGVAVQCRVSRSNPHSLMVVGGGIAQLNEGDILEEVSLQRGERRLPIGRCRLEVPTATFETDRRLVVLDDVVDFRPLVSRGLVITLEQRFQQLPLLLDHKRDIQPAFREYVADLVYDIQVFRSLFDDIDEGLQSESIDTRAEMRQHVIEHQGPRFREFLDRELTELEALVAGFTKKEHERHGYYFRKHIRDIIASSLFLARTNTRPRGYAGDSVLMQWIYENEYRGSSIFSQLMHKHPLETVAAEAVRNRRALIAERVREHHRQMTGDRSRRKVRMMSVACGPAWELRDLIRGPEDSGAYHIALLDQDTHALAEARDSVEQLVERYGVEIDTQFIRGSVRTMLRDRKLVERWGRFDFIYSLGLFDYLTRPVASAVLHKLSSLLRPGGRLIIGNFHVDNPTRTYMEYWMDWVLMYRTEQEMLDLVSDLEDVTVDLSFEQTRTQMFLEVQRRGARASEHRR